MPRPPRSKVASTTTRTTRTTRVAKQPAPPKQSAKSTAAQTKKASAILNSFSEDSDGLVTKSKTTRPRRGMPWEKTPELVDEADLVMTGALPTEQDVPVASIKKRTPAPKAKTTRTTRGNARTSTSMNSPPTRVLTQTHSPVDAAQEKAAHQGEISGFGDLTFSSLGSDSPAHGTRPPSAIKVGATPAHETSILALTNFKRRARQPSLLRMVQQTTDAEDNDDDTLDDTEHLDFDDFVPHDESTPLNVRRSAPEDELRNDSGTQVSSSDSRGTKRKLSPVIQVPRSSPPCDPPSSSELGSVRSPSPSLPDVTPLRAEAVAQTQEDSEPPSEILASPKSSSPVRQIAEATSSPAQTRVVGRGRQARKATYYNDESEGEETETPAKTKAKKGAKAKAQQSISTAQLKDLLPRRRIRTRHDRDEFDVESSDVDVEMEMDSEQDELQMPARRNQQRKPTSPKVTKKNARGKKATTSTKATQKTTRTYGRRISADKENTAQANDVGEADESTIIEHSAKLAAIRKKFEEVDAFELEFETVDVTASSSPFR